MTDAKEQAYLFHWRGGDKPAGTTKMEIQAWYVPGAEPYLLIGEEDCMPFEPNSGSFKMSLSDILEATCLWSIRAYNESAEYTFDSMADHLEMMAKLYRRKAAQEKTESQPMTSNVTQHKNGGGDDKTAN